MTQQPGLSPTRLILPLAGRCEWRIDSDHGAQHQVSSLGYRYRSGVVTTDGKFTLRSGYVQIKAKMSEASLGGWPAIWFIDPSNGGSQEIDLQEGGLTPEGVGLPAGTPENNIFVSTYHTPSGSQSSLSYATPKPMDTGFQHLRDGVHPWPVDQDVLQR